MLASGYIRVHALTPGLCVCAWRAGEGRTSDRVRELHRAVCLEDDAASYRCKPFLLSSSHNCHAFNPRHPRVWGRGEEEDEAVDEREEWLGRDEVCVCVCGGVMSRVMSDRSHFTGHRGRFVGRRRHRVNKTEIRRHDSLHVCVHVI